MRKLWVAPAAILFPLVSACTPELDFWNGLTEKYEIGCEIGLRGRYVDMAPVGDGWWRCEGEQSTRTRCQNLLTLDPRFTDDDVYRPSGTPPSVCNPAPNTRRGARGYIR